MCYVIYPSVSNPAVKLKFNSTSSTGECDQVTMARFFKDLIASERTSVDSVVVVSAESDQFQDLLIRSQDDFEEDEELIFVTAVPTLEDYHDGFSYSTLYLVADLQVHEQLQRVVVVQYSKLLACDGNGQLDQRLQAVTQPVPYLLLVIRNSLQRVRSRAQ